MNDDLDALSAEALDDALAATERRWGADLAAILRVPDDLTDRCAEEVRTALLARSVLSTGTDLLSVGWRTVRLLLAADPPPVVTSAPKGDVPR